MKYFGLDVDGSWSFREHFRIMATRGEEASASLARLMPNLRSPHERKRRFYSMVVHSMMLYGALVWAKVLACGCTESCLCLSHGVGGSCGNVGTHSPIDLQAEVLRLVFLKMRQEQADRGELDPVAIRKYRAQVTRDIVDK